MLCLALVFAHVCIVEAFVFCSREVFGVPNYRDCTRALSAIPTDNVVQFFVEQQLRTALPGANWPSFRDPRPVGQQEPIVQVPKWWSYGKASLGTIALSTLSFLLETKKHIAKGII